MCTNPPLTAMLCWDRVRPCELLTLDDAVFVLAQVRPDATAPPTLLRYGHPDVVCQPAGGGPFGTQWWSATLLRKCVGAYALANTQGTAWFVHGVTGEMPPLCVDEDNALWINDEPDTGVRAHAELCVTHTLAWRVTWPFAVYVGAAHLVTVDEECAAALRAGAVPAWLGVHAAGTYALRIGDMDLTAAFSAVRVVPL